MLNDNLNNSPEIQNDYIKLIAEIMEIRKRGEVPLAYIRTYGCQQNVADSEKIKGMLSMCGYEFTDNPNGFSAKPKRSYSPILPIRISCPVFNVPAWAFFKSSL